MPVYIAPVLADAEITLFPWDFRYQRAGFSQNVAGKNIAYCFYMQLYAAK